MKEKRRQNGEGTIYQRSNGLWVCEITLGYAPDGKRIKKTMSSMNLETLKKKINNTKYLKDRQMISEPSKYTISDWVEFWLETYKKGSIKPTTYDMYNGCLTRYIKPQIGHYKLDTLTPIVIQRFINDLSAKGINKNYDVYLHPYTVKRMLTNPLYIGTYHGIREFCEPLIEEAKFQEIQNIIKSKNIKATPSEYDFIFSGLLVCAECGCHMSGNAQKRTYRGGSKKWYVVYRCNNHFGNGRCTHNRAINEKYIENFLLQNIETEINKFVYSFKLEQKKKKTPKINKSEILRKLEKLKELYLNDLINIEMYKKDFEKLNSKLLTVEIPEQKNDLSPLYKFLESGFLKVYDTLDNEAKRIVWRGIINKLIITNDNEITIEFTN